MLLSLRELIGTTAQRGWRPSLIGWGLGSALVALAWALVWRFANGTTSLQDFAALAAFIPLAQYIHIRGPASPGVQPPLPGGGLVNQEAIA